MFFMFPVSKNSWVNINLFQTTLPTLDEEGKLVLEQEAIMNIREKRLRYHIIKEYLIKWKSCLPICDTPPFPSVPLSNNCYLGLPDPHISEITLSLSNKSSNH